MARSALIWEILVKGKMENCILDLARIFQSNPLQFFHEGEVHSTFFGLARNALGEAQTSDGHTVHLLRQEYNTLWRYRRKGDDGFSERFSNKGEGDVGEIDFVVLKRSFVEANRYLTVMNKEEDFRSRLRIVPWPNAELSPMIQHGLEFKMAHVHLEGPPPHGQAVCVSDFNQKEMVLDCRKLACERVEVAYFVALTHATHLRWFDTDYVAALFNTCIQEWDRCYDGPGEALTRLRLLVVAPNQCFRWGAWSVGFPNELIVEA